VELNVSKNIENELNQVTGLEEYISVSSDNLSVVGVSINIDREDARSIINEVKDAVNRAEAEFPEEVEKPEITEIETENIAILRYLVTSNTLPEETLRIVTDQLEDKLRYLEPVAQIRKTAYREPAIRVQADLPKLDRYRISLSEISRAIRNYNIRSGGGSLESRTSEMGIVTLNQFKDANEVKKVIIRSNFEGKKVRIEQVADVIRDFEERIFFIRGNQRNGIMLEVVKKAQYDIIDTADFIGKKVDAFRKGVQEKYGEELKIVNIFDFSKSTEDLLRITQNNALIGFFLVLVSLLVFLDFRSAFWTAFGIPIALLMVMTAMYAFGFSINNISLFGILTVLGIMVDDGIIVAENIFSKREQGLNLRKASIEGTSQIFPPVLTTITTTIIAFIPLASMSGIIGAFVYQLPMVVIIALIASMLEVFIALPAHISGGLFRGKEKKEKKKAEMSKWFKGFLYRYRKFLGKTLKGRYLVFLLFIILFGFTLWMAGRMDFILFSNAQADEIQISLEARFDTPLELMQERVMKVEELIMKNLSYDKNLDSLVSHVGTKDLNALSYDPPAGNKALIQIMLVPYSQREITAEEMAETLSGQLKEKFDFGEMIVRTVQAGPPVGKPVEVKIISNNDSLRKEYAEKVKGFLGGIKGVYDIQDDSQDTIREIRLNLNQSEMARLGVQASVVAHIVRTAFSGVEITSIVQKEDDIEIILEVNEKYQRRVEYLKELLVPTFYNNQIRLRQIADFPVYERQIAIRRYEGKRAITITSRIDKDTVTSQEVNQRILERFQEELDRHPELRLKIGGEGEETQESLANAFNSFIYAVIGIFVIVVIIFRSFSQPLIILSAIPFGFIGIVWAFHLHGEPIQFFTLIGGIGLAGVIVNDSIILVHFINQIKKKGDSFRKVCEKVSDAAGQRLRPVILTTVTTVMGLLPTVYGVGGSNPMLKPLAMALSYGLIFGTTITLILIPNLYLIEADLKRWGRKAALKIKGIF
jgi:multidrug efflux pump subunit AcrB